MSDTEYLEQLMELHTDHLFRIAYYYTKNLRIAEDIVQDVFNQLCLGVIASGIGFVLAQRTPFRFRDIRRRL
ncbi:hypothetical protein LSPCS325_27900 [Lysinibacillus sp. CTST325]